MSRIKGIRDPADLIRRSPLPRFDAFPAAARYAVRNILCHIILKDEELETVKNTIRERTNGFKDIKGCMYSFSIEDYEGSL